MKMMLMEFQMVLLWFKYKVAIDHNSDNILIGMNAKTKSLSY